MPYRKSYIQYRLYLALVLLIVLIFVGTMGFVVIADYSFVNALYMTVITVSTVGFKEVEPLDTEAKLFTVLLIIFSVGMFGYIISVVTDYITNNKFMEEIKFKKMQKKISTLNGHTIVCGFGRNGQQAMARLASYNKDCVIVESDPERASFA